MGSGKTRFLKFLYPIHLESEKSRGCKVSLLVFAVFV